jgi:hypothetical protein
MMFAVVCHLIMLVVGWFVGGFAISTWGTADVIRAALAIVFANVITQVAIHARGAWPK